MSTIFTGGALTIVNPVLLEIDISHLIILVAKNDAVDVAAR
jgi:hypothetical protein